MKCSPKTALYLVISVFLMIVLSSCGTAAGSAAPPPAAESPSPAATPAPTPSPEPELFPHELLTVDGVPSKGSFVDSDGLIYASFDEMAELLGLELGTERDYISFSWRKQQVLLRQDDELILVDRQRFDLGGKLISADGELYVPLEGFCKALNISVFYDEELSHLYCTPEAGDWEYASGYKIPVFMYHTTSHYKPATDTLNLNPVHMEEQLKFLQDNGYETIFFGDIAHIEDYEKPVILTFDDGDISNYDVLFPLLQKYNAKATFFLMSSSMDSDSPLRINPEQARELSQSGLVDIQSHSHHHVSLGVQSDETVRTELGTSKLLLTRATGKEPFVLCYPCGSEDEFVRTAAVDEFNFNFGLKMTGDVYVTGDDPMLIYRYYVNVNINDYRLKLEAEPED